MNKNEEDFDEDQFTLKWTFIVGGIAILLTLLLIAFFGAKTDYDCIRKYANEYCNSRFGTNYSFAGDEVFDCVNPEYNERLGENKKATEDFYYLGNETDNCQTKWRTFLFGLK